MRNILIAIFLFSFLFFGSVCNAETDTIKVLDSNGLVRAVKQINQTASVEIQTSEPDMKLSLQSMDKLQAEIVGEGQGKKVIFRDVTSGTWRITGSQNGISKVTINSGQN